MKINITDIPPQGRDLQFELNETSLNTRSRADRANHDSREEILPPEYIFQHGSKAELHLNLHGKTVMINGRAHAVYSTSCSRCAEETRKELEVPVDMVLKPLPPEARATDIVEDVQIGFYDGKEVDCESVVEEFLMLSLPFTVICREECKGLCPKCGANLNAGKCSCPEDESTDDRFAILKSLKLQ